MCGGFSGMCCGFCWTGVGFRTQSWCRQQAHRGAALTGTGKAQGDVSGGRRRTRIQGWQRPLPQSWPHLCPSCHSPLSLCAARSLPGPSAPREKALTGGSAGSGLCVPSGCVSSNSHQDVLEPRAEPGETERVLNTGCRAQQQERRTKAIAKSQNQRLRDELDR